MAAWEADGERATSGSCRVRDIWGWRGDFGIGGLWVYGPWMERLRVVNARMEGSLEIGASRVLRDRSWGP